MQKQGYRKTLHIPKQTKNCTTCVLYQATHLLALICVYVCVGEQDFHDFR